MAILAEGPLNLREQNTLTHFLLQSFTRQTEHLCQVLERSEIPTVWFCRVFSCMDTQPTTTISYDSFQSKVVS